MKVLLIGDGAREHALALLIAGSALEPRVAVLAGHANPGLEKVAESSGAKVYRGAVSSPLDAVRAAEDFSPDLVVVGPEEPLFAGVANALRERGFTVFGPSSEAARIEKDKVFARTLMWKHRIPGRLRFKVFNSPEEVAKHASALGDVAVKPARQAGGRGVRVFAETYEHLLDAVREVASEYAAKVARHVKSAYSDIDHAVIVEEFVEGVEYTVMTVTDGESVAALPAVQDHPHLLPFDLGPETGGMGAISGPCETLPFVSKREYEESVEIVRRTVEALQREVGEPYVGALSGQMMLTGFWGPTLIEYYARFGDPEIAAMLYMVESDFLELLDRAATRRLSGYKLKLRCDTYVVVKAAAPAGYPADRARARGHPIAVDERGIREAGCTILYGGVDRAPDGTLVTTGSRAVEVACSSTTSFQEASERAERAIGRVKLLDGHALIHRWDIGTEELLRRRAALADMVRLSYTRRRERGLFTVYDWVPGRGVVRYDYAV
ncbi:MAG: phosphoribosylamine--glycine ligase [Thermoproteota archaeon]